MCVQCDGEIKFGMTKQSQVFDEDGEKNTWICAQNRAGWFYLKRILYNSGPVNFELHEVSSASTVNRIYKRL